MNSDAIVNPCTAPDRSALPDLERHSDTGSHDSLVLDNLGIVSFVMQRLTPKLPRSIDRDDIRSVGILGLTDAASRFDPTRSVRFRTYAEVRVRGAILDYLRSLSWAPRGLHQRAREIDAARNAIELRTHSCASVPEIAAELGIGLDECHSLIAQVERIEMAEAANVRESVHRQPFGGMATSDPLHDLQRKEKLAMIWKIVGLLPERQKLVLWLYYHEEFTIKEVGAILNVNESRASQLHSKAIAAVRREVTGPLGVNKRVRSARSAGPASKQTCQSPA